MKDLLTIPLEMNMNMVGRGQKIIPQVGSVSTRTGKMISEEDSPLPTIQENGLRIKGMPIFSEDPMQVTPHTTDLAPVDGIHQNEASRALPIGLNIESMPPTDGTVKESQKRVTRDLCCLQKQQETHPPQVLQQLLPQR